MVFEQNKIISGIDGNINNLQNRINESNSIVNKITDLYSQYINPKDFSDIFDKNIT